MWIGNYTDLLTGKTVDSKGGSHRFTEARIKPSVQQLLDILVPALCQRNPAPFRWFADAIDALNAVRIPDHAVAFRALSLAFELAGRDPPFSATGEPVDADPQQASADSALTVPLSESEFRRRA